MPLAVTPEAETQNANPLTGSPEAGVLILGIGNVLLSDEGVGVHALSALAARQALPPSAMLLDGGTMSFTLAGPIEEAESLIVIDAAELQDEPGAVRVFEGEAMDRFLARTGRRSVHEVGLMDLMDVARLNGSLPGRRALIGVQPATLGWGDTCSAPVTDALPRVCDEVMTLSQRWST